IFDSAGRGEFEGLPKSEAFGSLFNRGHFRHGLRHARLWAAASTARQADADVPASRPVKLRNVHRIARRVSEGSDALELSRARSAGAWHNRQLRLWLIRTSSRTAVTDSLSIVVLKGALGSGAWRSSTSCGTRSVRSS